MHHMSAHQLPRYYQPQIAQSAGAVEYTDRTSAEGRDPPNECPRCDTKQSDGEAPVMLELCGMQSTPSLPSLPGPLWTRVVATDKSPMYGLNRTKLWFEFFFFFFFAFKLHIYAKLNCLK